MTRSRHGSPVLLALAAVAALLLLPGLAWATVDQGEVCLDCHDDVASEISLPVEHPPAKRAECSSCHNPHAARDEGLLLERPAILCVSCHQEIAEHLGRSVLHQPVAEGRCNSCHRAHGSIHQGLLGASGADLCLSCHESIAGWQELANQHSPFRRGRCADCHEPHGSQHPRLQTAAGGAVCTSCHPTSAKFRSDHGGYPVEQADCQQCHDPHASRQAGLLRQHPHAPFTDGDCTLCHATAGSAAPFALNATQDELCGDCHDDAVQENRAAAFPHVAAGGSRCSACHNPHGGDRPLLLVDNPVDLCGLCHAHQHAITHPMGEDALDPRNGQGMDCLSCHGLHEAAADKYLHRDGARELCIGCHKDKGVPR